MLFASAHVRVAAEYGIATLELAFPGDPVNALDAARLAELDAAFAAIEGNRLIHALVVRSARPAGFCAGLHPQARSSLSTSAERGHFSWHGQRVCDRLARLPFTTVAFIDGSCLGAGLELALACDHRLCVARPTTHIGWQRGVLPCFGGSVRLKRLIGRYAATRFMTDRTLSGREAQKLGLVDHAFCERRAKIELRTFLDAHERRGKSSPQRVVGGFGFAAERRAFARVPMPATRAAWTFEPHHNPIPEFPATVGLIGHDEDAAEFITQAVLRGACALLTDSAEDVNRGIEVACARGFITPLEAEQARSRVRIVVDSTDFKRAGLVFVAHVPHSFPELSVRAVVALCRGVDHTAIPHPRRVLGIRFGDSRMELISQTFTDADTLATVASWFSAFGQCFAMASADSSHARAA